jgi:hypothetical protein
VSLYLEQLQQLHDRMSQPIGGPGAGSGVLFGRFDPNYLGPKATQLLTSPPDVDRVERLVITGGKAGKDRGILGHPNIDMSESEALGAQVLASGEVDPDRLFLEKFASNGGQNARYSLTALERLGWPLDTIMVIAHGASLLRLAMTMVFEAGKLGIEFELKARPSGRPLDLYNRQEVEEVIAEAKRLVNPADNFLGTTYAPGFAPGEEYAELYHELVNQSQPD